MNYYFFTKSVKAFFFQSNILSTKTITVHMRIDPPWKSQWNRKEPGKQSGKEIAYISKPPATDSSTSNNFTKGRNRIV